jgi:hypothetical protein
VIDPYTFGDTLAGELLVGQLNRKNDSRLTRRVSSFLHHTFAGFAALAPIEDDQLYKEFIVLWRKHRQSKINFHKDVNSLMGSIIVAMSRDWLRGMEDNE